MRAAQPLYGFRKGHSAMLEVYIISSILYAARALAVSGACRVRGLYSFAFFAERESERCTRSDDGAGCEKPRDFYYGARVATTM